MSFSSEFQFLPGDPEAVHSPDGPYRLPFALATTFPVSQAYPDPDRARGILERACGGFFDADRHADLRGARRHRDRGGERLFRQRAWSSFPSTVRERTWFACCTQTARWRYTRT